MEKAIEKAQNLHSLKVFDSEKEDWVDVSPDIQRRAAYVHQQIAMGSFMIALAIKKMFDEKLYIGLGCSSKTEYCETRLPFSRQQAYRYYSIGKKFQKYLPGNGESVTPGLQIEDLGYKKLYELTKLDDADFEELMETGEVGDFNLERFKQQTYNDAAAELAVLRSKSQNRISNLETENAKLKSEAKALLEKKAEADELYTQATEMKNIYGPMKKSYEEKSGALKMGKKLLDQASCLILGCEVNADDPLPLLKEAADIYLCLHVTIDYFKMNYGDVLFQIEDLTFGAIKTKDLIL